MENDAKARLAEHDHVLSTIYGAALGSAMVTKSRDAGGDTYSILVTFGSVLLVLLTTVYIFSMIRRLAWIILERRKPSRSAVVIRLATGLLMFVICAGIWSNDLEQGAVFTAIVFTYALTYLFLAVTGRGDAQRSRVQS